MRTRTRPGSEPVPALNDVLEGRSPYRPDGDFVTGEAERRDYPSPPEPPPLADVRWIAPKASAVRRMADRVADLEIQVEAQNAHIAFLHDQLDQVVEQIQTIHLDLGMGGGWRPTVRAPHANEPAAQS